MIGKYHLNILSFTSRWYVLWYYVYLCT